MRQTFVFRDGELVEKRDAAPLNASAYVISDNMDAAMNHADGRIYDSKSAFTKAVRAAGCQIVGNDQSAPRQDFKPSVTGRDIARTIEQLRSRNG